MTLTQNYKFAKNGPKTEMCSNFYGVWHLEQIEHANDEYSTWNWLSWPKIINSSKFDPKIECASIFMKFGTQDIFKFLLIM